MYISKQMKRSILVLLLLAHATPAQAFWGQDTLSSWWNSTKSYVSHVVSSPREHTGIIASVVGVFATAGGYFGWRYWNQNHQDAPVATDSDSDISDASDEGAQEPDQSESYQGEYVKPKQAVREWQSNKPSKLATQINEQDCLLVDPLSSQGSVQQSEGVDIDSGHDDSAQGTSVIDSVEYQRPTNLDFVHEFDTTKLPKGLLQVWQEKTVDEQQTCIDEAKNHQDGLRMGLLSQLENECKQQFEKLFNTLPEHLQLLCQKYYPIEQQANVAGQVGIQERFNTLKERLEDLYQQILPERPVQTDLQLRVSPSTSQDIQGGYPTDSDSDISESSDDYVRDFDAPKAYEGKGKGKVTQETKGRRAFIREQKERDQKIEKRRQETFSRRIAEEYSQDVNSNERQDYDEASLSETTLKFLDTLDDVSFKTYIEYGGTYGTNALNDLCDYALDLYENMREEQRRIPSSSTAAPSDEAHDDFMQYKYVLPELSPESLLFLKTYEYDIQRLLLDEASKNGAEALTSIRLRLQAQVSNQQEDASSQTAVFSTDEDAIKQAIEHSSASSGSFDGNTLQALRHQAGYGSSSDSDDDTDFEAQTRTWVIRQHLSDAFRQLDQNNDTAIKVSAEGFNQAFCFFVRRFEPKNGSQGKRALVLSLHGTKSSAEEFGGNQNRAPSAALLASMQQMANENGVAIDMIIPQWSSRFCEADRQEAAEFIRQLVVDWYELNKQIAHIDFIGHSEANSIIKVMLDGMQPNIKQQVRWLSVSPTAGSTEAAEGIGARVTVWSPADFLAFIGSGTRFSAFRKPEGIHLRQDNSLCTNMCMRHNGAYVNHVNVKLPTFLRYNEIFSAAEAYRGCCELSINVQDDAAQDEDKLLVAIRKDDADCMRSDISSDHRKTMHAISQKAEDRFKQLHPSINWHEKPHDNLSFLARFFQHGYNEVQAARANAQTAIGASTAAALAQSLPQSTARATLGEVRILRGALVHYILTKQNKNQQIYQTINSPALKRTLIADLIWYWHFLAQQRGQEFTEGTYQIVDAQPIYDFIMSAELKERNSTHFAAFAQKEDMPDPRMNKVHYGLDIKGLPNGMTTILIGSLNNDGSRFFVKPESHGVQDLHAYVAHGMSMLTAQGRKLVDRHISEGTVRDRCEALVGGFDDQEGWRKERVPSSVLKSFNKLVDWMLIDEQQKNDMRNEAEAYGLSYIARIVFNSTYCTHLKDDRDYQSLSDQLRQYDYLAYRFGREVVICGAQPEERARRDAFLRNRLRQKDLLSDQELRTLFDACTNDRIAQLPGVQQAYERSRALDDRQFTAYQDLLSSQTAPQALAYLKEHKLLK